MYKKFTILLLCSILLVSCNMFSYGEKGKYNYFKETNLAVKAQIPADFIPQDITIVSAGDSLTEGVGDSTGRGGYIPTLEILLEQDKAINDAKVYNFGVKGYRSDQLLKKVKSNQVKNKIAEADIVILTIGGNDMMRVVRENFTSLDLRAFLRQKAVYEKNLKDVITAIRTDNPNSTIMLVGLYNPFIKWFSDIKEITQILEDWNTASMGILTQYPNTYFVKIDDIFMGNEEELLYKDQFHPNDRGYELIGERIYATLKGGPFRKWQIDLNLDGNEERGS